MPTSAGTYQIKISCAATTDYKAATSAAVSFSVSKVELTATYTGDSITFGGTPALAVTVTGFISGESDSTAAGYTAPTVANSHTDTGSYNLSPSNGAATNYSFKYVAGTLLIEQAQPSLTLTAGLSVAYTGLAALYPADKISNNGDGTSYTWQYSANGRDWNDGMPTHAGTYQVKATCAATTNYKTSASAAVSFTISKVELTASYAGESIFLRPDARPQRERQRFRERRKCHHGGGLHRPGGGQHAYGGGQL